MVITSINNYAFIWCYCYIINLKKSASTDPSKEKCWKMHKTIEHNLSSTYTFGMASALVLTKKWFLPSIISRYFFVFYALKWCYLFIYLFVNLFVYFFLLKVVSMEVVQDFINSPSLEKFKNISSSQRRSLLAEYFKVCNLAVIWYLIVYRIIPLFVNSEITCDQVF